MRVESEAGRSKSRGEWSTLQNTSLITARLLVVKEGKEQVASVEIKLCLKKIIIEYSFIKIFFCLDCRSGARKEKKNERRRDRTCNLL